MCVTALCKVHIIWTFCCTWNKAFMKVSEWLYWTSILNFERSFSLFPEPQSSFGRPCIISLEGPGSDYSMRIRFGLAWIDTSSTRMHDLPLSWLGTGISIKFVGVKLVFLSVKLCREYFLNIHDVFATDNQSIDN